MQLQANFKMSFCRCSVDPYLFENFNTVDGDFLTAKFKAFKFPESTYVQFKGTVNVCLDKCKGVSKHSNAVGFKAFRFMKDNTDDKCGCLVVTL